MGRCVWGDDPNTPPQPINLGFRAGRNVVCRFLPGLRTAGEYHVILNFKYGKRDAAENLEEIGQEILPQLEASQAAAVPHRQPRERVTID